MATITYRIITHRGSSRILVQFANNSEWSSRIRKVSDARWSKTYKAWHIPDTPENRQKCGLAPKQEIVPPKNKPVAAISSLTENNQQQLFLFLEKLTLKKYAANTITTYKNEFIQLLQLLENVPVQDLTPEHLKRYMLYCTVKLRLSENTLHSRLNALKFYFEQVLGHSKFFYDIPRPKKELQLPKVLNENELGKLFRSITNSKHKAIVFTAYSAGLRVSEVVNLRIEDIDAERMTIFVRKAKGKKDRMVNLSPLLLDILRAYLKKQKPMPKKYLFEGALQGQPYSIRAAQQIFKNGKTNAGISKTMGFHGLRHSFATHLIEKGVDIKYIKELLGHFDIKTTERYLHVSNSKLVNIVSPLDYLYEKGIL
jgi:site-specific recombinase XerD